MRKSNADAPSTGASALEKEVCKNRIRFIRRGHEPASFLRRGLFLHRLFDRDRHHDAQHTADKGSDELRPGDSLYVSLRSSGLPGAAESFLINISTPEARARALRRAMDSLAGRPSPTDPG